MCGKSRSIGIVLVLVSWIQGSCCFFVFTCGHNQATYTDRKLLVYHVPSKKAQGKAPELKSSFETSHKAVITDLSVSAFPALPASIFIVTSCRTKEDTHVFCWSPKSGECLARVDTGKCSLYSIYFFSFCNFVYFTSTQLKLKITEVWFHLLDNCWLFLHGQMRYVVIIERFVLVFTYRYRSCSLKYGDVSKRRVLCIA